jgi:hypothetical protein
MGLGEKEKKSYHAVFISVQIFNLCNHLQAIRIVAKVACTFLIQYDGFTDGPG